MKAYGTYEIEGKRAGRYRVQITDIIVPVGIKLDDELVSRLNSHVDSMPNLNGQFVLDSPTALLFYLTDADHWPACVSSLQAALAEFFGGAQPIHYTNQLGTAYELDRQGQIRREEGSAS
jgi:hypothetical protein